MPESITFAGQPYEVGGYYPFADLPSKTKRDALEQTAELELAFGRSARDLTYQLVMIPRDDLLRLVEERYGKGLAKQLRSREVENLVSQIRTKGLQYPPIGEEGWKRALAVVTLGWEYLPYFQVVTPFEWPARAVASLEGTAGNGEHPWRVELEYKGMDPDIDSELQRMAAVRGGKHLGAGFFFPTETRDHGFKFESEKEARAFAEEAKIAFRHVKIVDLEPYSR